MPEDYRRIPTPEESFLAAILANPDDDAPRLMYSDWLTEHGRPQGEFIRVQIRLAHLGKTRITHEERLLRERESDLFFEHGPYVLSGTAREDWQCDEVDYGCHLWPTLPWFHRGFVEAVEVAGIGYLAFCAWASRCYHSLLRKITLTKWDGYIDEIGFVCKWAKVLHFDGSAVMSVDEAQRFCGVRYGTGTGWMKVLEELVVERATTEARDYLLQHLQRQVVEVNGVRYSAENEKGSRKILRQPAIAGDPISFEQTTRGVRYRHAPP